MSTKLTHENSTSLVKNKEEKGEERESRRTLMSGEDEYCVCKHPKSKHEIRGNGKCRAEQRLDKDGAPTQQLTFCECEKFVPPPMK
jgi:hypothetical protein